MNILLIFNKINTFWFFYNIIILFSIFTAICFILIIFLIIIIFLTFIKHPNDLSFKISFEYHYKIDHLELFNLNKFTNNKKYFEHNSIRFIMDIRQSLFHNYLNGDYGQTDVYKLLKEIDDNKVNLKDFKLPIFETIKFETKFEGQTVYFWIKIVINRIISDKGLIYGNLFINEFDREEKVNDLVKYNISFEKKEGLSAYFNTFLFDTKEEWLILAFDFQPTFNILLNNLFYNSILNFYKNLKNELQQYITIYKAFYIEQNQLFFFTQLKNKQKLLWKEVEEIIQEFWKKESLILFQNQVNTTFTYELLIESDIKKFKKDNIFFQKIFLTLNYLIVVNQTLINSKNITNQVLKEFFLSREKNILIELEKELFIEEMIQINNKSKMEKGLYFANTVDIQFYSKYDLLLLIEKILITFNKKYHQNKSKYDFYVIEIPFSHIYNERSNFIEMLKKNLQGFNNVYIHVKDLILNQNEVTYLLPFFNELKENNFKLALQPLNVIEPNLFLQMNYFIKPKIIFVSFSTLRELDSNIYSQTKLYEFIDFFKKNIPDCMFVIYSFNKEVEINLAKLKNDYFNNLKTYIKK